MATGKVKWFNNAKGYGFVLALTGGEDLFVHYSSIHMDGYKTLKAGQLVDFDVQQGPKGLHAVNIRLAESAPDDVPASDYGSNHGSGDQADAQAKDQASVDPRPNRQKRSELADSR
jgi:CspA family cold shock protein